MTLELAFILSGPIFTGIAMLIVLRNSPDPSLALPPAAMILMVTQAQNASMKPWYAALLASVGMCVVLWACLRQRRRIAACAVVACVVASVWLVLSPTLANA